ncbi:MAG: ABC transporter substrate-binding protein, partial [Chloroflexota bacterium]
NEDLCDQIVAARAETAPVTQEILYETISQQIHDDIPLVPFVHVKTSSILRQDVNGLATEWYGVGTTSFLNVTYDRNELTYAIQRAPSVLDPALFYESNIYTVTSQVMDTLLRTESGIPVPALAESWSVSPDGLTWTFTIRSGVTFHDGTPLDAAAVLYNLERWWDPDHLYHDGAFTHFGVIFNGFKGDPASLITNIAASGNNQVQITLSEPFSPLLNALAVPSLAIASPTAIQAGTMNTHPVGTGPFVFEDWSSDVVNLTANTNYWGGAPTLANLNFKVISDDAARYAALQANTVQGMELGSFSFAQTSWGYILMAQNDPTLQVVWHPEMNTGYLGINQAHGPLGNVLVRKAIAHAIDKQTLIAQHYNAVTFGTGTWVADFAHPGDENDEQSTWDIKVGDGGDAQQCDEDGDCTFFGMNIPNPHLTVFPENEAVEAWEWPDGSTIHLAVDDPATSANPDYEQDGVIAVTTWGDPRTYIRFEFSGEYDLKIGDSVTVTDGKTSQTHVVQYLTLTEINAETEIVAGTTDPGRVVYVWPHGNGEYELHPIADGSGNWQADFKTVGYDVQSGTDGGRSEVRDEYGNSTAVDWNVPNPSFGARPKDDVIEGWQWPVGATVTVEIDDPAVAGTVNYTGQAEVYVPDWNPNETRFDLNFNGQYDLKPDDIVTVTDGTTTKTHVVTNFELVEINPNTDMVYGYANPNILINVWACDNDGCVNREETSDQSGNWQTNFSIPGDLNWEQDTIDLQPGTWIDSSQNDDDGDGTYFGRIAGSTFSGTVYLIEAAPENAAAGVLIEACTSDNFCKTALTDGDGNYWVSGLQGGAYTLRAISPGTNLPGSLGPIDISYDEILSGRDIIVPEPPLPPPPDAVEPAHSGGGTIAVYWMDDLVLTAYGCMNGTAAFELTVLNDGYTVNGSMTETLTGSGTYKATIPPLYPHHGVAEIIYTIICPDGSTVETPFFIYIDPSGVVKNTNGEPIPDATVTLFYSEKPDGPFTEVADGSVLMSPSNRKNPDTTDANGQFGWDVVAGFYKVRVEKAGCVSVTDPTQTFIESAILTIPPPVTGLELILKCPLPPLANAGPDRVTEAGKAITLDASASSDPEGGALTYAWDLDNDGQYDDATGVTTTTAFMQIGDHTIGLRVTDADGLSATDTVTVTVSAWTLKGFYQPVDMNGVYNLVKGGSTVPLKFEIFAGPTELTDIADVKSLTYAQTSCDATAATDEIETIVTGGTSLRYDTTAGQFIYNWKTPKSPGKCYRVTMVTMDGSSLVAYFKLK